MKYVIPRGSSAAKAIKYLRTLPPGTQVESTQLAAAIGMTGNPKCLHNNVRRAVAVGLLHCQRVAGFGNRLYWSLPDAEPIPLAKPKPEPEPDDEVDTAPILRAAPQIKPRPGPFLPGIQVGEGARRITPVCVYAMLPEA